MDRSIIDVPITTGLDQRADTRELKASGAVTMTNCVMVNNGAVQKRFGNTQVVSHVSGGIVLGGGSYKGAPWLTGGQTLLSASEAGGGVFAIDAIPEASVADRLGLSSWLSNAFDWDMVAVGNLFVFVMTGDTTNPSAAGAHKLYYGVIDATTNATIVSLQLVDIGMASGAFAPKVILCGLTVVLTYVDSVANTLLSGRLFSTGTLTFSAPTTINVGAIAGNFSSGIYDVCPIAGDPTHFMALAETNNAGGHMQYNKVTVATLVTLVAVNVDLAVSNVVSCAVASDTTAGTFGIYGGDVAGPATVLRASGADSGFAAAAAVTVYTWAVTPGRMDVIITGATTAMAAFSPQCAFSTSYANVSQAFTATAGLSIAGGFVSVTVPANTRPCTQLYSRLLRTAYGAANAIYAVVVVPSNTQGTAYLVRWPEPDTSGVPPTWVATFDPRLTKYMLNLSPSIGGGNRGLSAPHIMADATMGTAAWVVPVPESTSPSHSSLFAQRFDLASWSRFSSGELYELEAIALGVPSVYDGQEVVEMGYANHPEVSASVGAGAGINDGVYSYICIFEWYDARGQVHRSATSPAVTVTAANGANNNIITVNSTTLGLTNRRQLLTLNPQKSLPFRIVYRTTAGGTIFYRLTADPPASTDQVSLSTATLALVDTTADASITANATLYTTGGQLDNYNPPSARLAFVFNNRWMLAGGPDPTLLWASKFLTPGEAPGFNEGQNIQASGAIRAGVQMDDKCILFVQRGSSYGIEYFTGQGPLDTGTQSDWTAPQQVPSDTGAVNQRGVCVGPFGVMFHGTTGGLENTGGLFILTRDLQVKYVSGPVASLLKAYPYVSSMVLHPRNGRVYITCTATQGSATGVRLVWDFDQDGVWSSDLLNDTLAPQAATGVACAFVGTSVVAGGPAYYWASTAGNFYRENIAGGASVYTDNGAWVTARYQSAWLKPQKSGFVRFWKAFVSLDALDPADVTLQLTYDYAASSYYNESHTWTAAQVATFDRAPQVDLQMIPGNQKAKSIQFTITDAPPTGAALVSGQGFSLGALALELGVKDGGYRNTPSGQRS